MEAVRIETTVAAGGRLTVEGLPFRAGEAVEVIVLARESRAEENGDSRYPLRGLPITYVDPVEPVADQDWTAAS